MKNVYPTGNWGIYPLFGWVPWIWAARAPWDYLQAANENFVGENNGQDS